MNGYEERARQKRDNILKSALHLFQRKGVTRTTVSEIAARAGVSRVTLFKYFGDKKTLAREAMMSIITKNLGEFDRIIESDIPYMQKFNGLLRLKRLGIEEIGETFMQTTAWEDPEMRRIMRELIERESMPRLIRLIRAGKVEGVIRASLPEEAILAYISALIPLATSPEFLKKSRDYQWATVELIIGGLTGTHDVRKPQS